MKIRTGSKIILTTVCGIVLFLTFIFLPVSCQKKEKQDGPMEKVTIGVGSLPLSATVKVAKEKRFFSDEGLDVTYTSYPFARKAMEAMFRGEADIATVAEMPIVFNSFIRDDFVIFATFAYSYDNSRIIAGKDRGIAMPADLKGKKIGITARTSSHFFAHVYLNEYGIDSSSVELLDLAPPDMPDALKEGRVDAIVAFSPYTYLAMKAVSDKTAELPRNDLFKETFNLVTMKSYTKKHPETLKKLLKAVDRSITYIKQNRTESLAIMTQGAGAEETMVASSLDDFVFDLSLDNSLFIILEDEARWAIENRFTDKTKVPNYLEYFYPDAMKAVKPDAVSIIR